MRKGLPFLWALALAACAGGGGSPSNPSGVLPASNGATTESAVTQGAVLQSLGTTWNIGTGASTYSYALQDLDFYPNSITIDAGDSVAYHVASGVGGDAHTISFVPAGMTVPSPFNPADLMPAGGTVVDGTKFVNSGIQLGGQVFTLTFPKPGTYRILCLFHEPAMVMTVVVQNAGAAYPHTAQYYLTQGSNELWEDLGAAQVSIRSFPFTVGGTTIAAGISPHLTAPPPADSTVLRFIDSNNSTGTFIGSEGNFSFKVGTVLTFVNESNNEPHTVTFAAAGQTALPNIAPDQNKAPAGVANFDGSTYINSGTLPPGGRFQIKLLKAGKFVYGCLYHDNSRMGGVMTVTST